MTDLKIKKLHFVAAATLNGLVIRLPFYAAVALQNYNEYGFDVEVYAVSTTPLDRSDKGDFIVLNANGITIDRTREIQDSLQFQHGSLQQTIEFYVRAMEEDGRYKELEAVTDYDLEI